MRILHINCNYIGTTLHQLMIERLDALGFENQVFVPTYDKNLSVIKPNSNVLVSECFRKWDRIWFDYKQSKILKAIEKAYDISSFDCIHAYTVFTDGNCARKLSEKYGIPYVVAVRNTDVNDFFRLMPHLRHRGIENMQKAKAVFFLSEAYKNLVFEKYVPQHLQNLLEEKVTVIPNGIDRFWHDNAVTEQRKDKPLQDPVRLIYAGGIDRNKNITATQGAMKLLREEGIHTTLTTVGKIVDKTVYSQVISDSYTAYHSPCKKEELFRLYHAHDIFVMPSFTESFGLVYAEALSCGLPVIYSKGQGFDNQFPEGTVGFHVDAYDPRSVADGIRSVIENYSQIQKNTVSCSKKFDWNQITEQYDFVYKKIKEENR